MYRWTSTAPEDIAKVVATTGANWRTERSRNLSPYRSIARQVSTNGASRYWYTDESSSRVATACTQMLSAVFRDRVDPEARALKAGNVLERLGNRGVLSRDAVEAAKRNLKDFELQGARSRSLDRGRDVHQALAEWSETDAWPTAMAPSEFCKDSAHGSARMVCGRPSECHLSG